MISDSARTGKWLGVAPVGHSASCPVSAEHCPEAVCLARIRKVSCLPDGGLLMDLIGVARARVRATAISSRRYTLAQLELLAPGSEEAPGWHWLRKARSSIRALRGQVAGQSDPFPGDIWLDLLCHLLPVPFETKVQLLGESCNRRRCELLASYATRWDESKIMRHYLPQLSWR